MYDIVNLFDLNKLKQKISFLLSIFNLMQKTRGINFHSDIRCTRQAHVPHFWQCILIRAIVADDLGTPPYWF